MDWFTKPSGSHCTVPEIFSSLNFGPVTDRKQCIQAKHVHVLVTAHKVQCHKRNYLTQWVEDLSL